MNPMRNFQPTISVILPVHNGESYLREALDSILAQTYRDFELIAIDDGSTDGTRAILDEYALHDSRIRVVSRQQRGLVATLNEGIDLARGVWIARMDADDIAMSDRFAVQLAQLKHSQADFCGGAVECFGAWRNVWRYPVSHTACEAHLLFEVPFAHPAVIGRRTAFAALRYDDQYRYAEDYDLWQRACAAGYRFTNVSRIVLRYRVHARQVSSCNQILQRQNADAVRRRHWHALLTDLESREIGRIVDVISYKHGKTAALMPALRQLLPRYPGEAQMVILSNSFRTFCYLAGNDPYAALNWWLLSKRGRLPSLKHIGKISILLVISLLRATPDSRLFLALRRMQAAISTRIVF